VWSSKKRPWKGGKDRTAVAKAFMLLSLPFILAEVATGIVSWLSGELKIPPLVGLGVAIDLVILLAGLGIAVAWATRSGPPKAVIPEDDSQEQRKSGT